MSMTVANDNLLGTYLKDRSIQFEYSAFAVDGRPDLSLVIYNPATPADADRIRSLVKPQTSAST
jgi:hypothetical protein